MKHVERRMFVSEREFRCKRRDDEFNTCGSCLTCIYTTKLSESTEWLSRVGDSSKRKFLIGLLVRCRSVRLLQSIQNVLRVTSGKDYTYTRSKKPSLPEDTVTCSSDRALDRNLLAIEMVETWDWFSRSHDWIKSNYLLAVLSLCNTELLRMLSNLTSVLLVREKQAFLHLNATGDTENEVSSIPESTYSFCSQDHPHLDLLMQASSVFEPVDLCSDMNTDTDYMDRSTAQPETCLTLGLSRSSYAHDPAQLANLGLGSLLNEKGDCGDSMSDSEDPALMVVPRSSASMSGVSRYRDFIRSLPVHLAKRILGLLDKHTLRCCRNVSLHWRYLTEDTTEDISAKRARWNQIMLMQSNRNNRLISDIYANVLEVLVPMKDDEEGDIPSNVQKDTPFAAAYANVKTKPVQMEERNVYCGVYTATVLLEKEDPYRVADYGGRQLVATGSKDRRVHLLNVASKEEATPVIKGHAGSVRAVLLCEDRGLVISAGYDLSIRCWNLRTKACVMLLCGHTDTINCLDIHGDKLVSGAKDSKVKVWDLQTGKCFEKLKFRHPGSVQCVKINATLVHSSCDKGLVKIWDMENASLLRVIHAHRSSVNCLFFDRWHLLSGDSDGQVMAWSTNCDTKKCLMIFHHPKEVQSLTLAYLRVITGCMDGKIRIFNFLTGDCLRVIKAEGKLSPILSLHFHDNNVLVNTTSSVLLYQFVKVSWVYAGSVEGGQRGVAVGQAGSATEKSFTSLRKFPHAFVRAERMAQVGSPNRKIYGCNGAKPERPELSHHARSLSAPRMRRAQDAQQESMRPATWSKLQSYRRSTAYIDLQPEFIAKPPSAISPGRPVSGWSQETTRIPSYTPKVREFSETSKMSVILSERAASERVKKRGLHHPLTTDHILLRVNAIQQAQRTDEASVNMELNARLRDAWTSPPPGDPLPSSLQGPNPELGSPWALKPSSRTQKPPPPQEVFNGVTKTYVPVFTRSKDHKTGNTLHGRAASTVPVAAIQRPQTGDCPVDHRPRSVCGKTRPHTAGTHMAVRKPGALTTSAEEEPQAPERMLMSTMHKHPGRHVKFETPGAPMPKTNLMDPFREQGGFRLLTETQLREYVRAQRESMQSIEQKSTKNNQEKERKLAWIMKVKGLPDGDFTNEGRVYTPESGHGVPN